MSIRYRDRNTGNIETEQVFHEGAIAFLYGKWGWPFRSLISKNALVSRLYGYLASRPASKKKIAPFIHQFNLNASEFVKEPAEFSSFNDFFTRKLKPSARPIAAGDDVAIIPADGRYLAVADLDAASGLFVKGEMFRLDELLQDEALTKKYRHGTMVIGRLCPTDYHRTHFPVDCLAGTPQLINGYLYSVNPAAIRTNVNIFTENKRVYTLLETESFGTVLYMEVGATCVGTIVQTATPGKAYRKGDEKSYFSFGGSTVILIFERDRIKLADDLLQTEEDRIELYCQMGEVMGKSTHHTT